MILAGDMGGTHTRLGLFNQSGEGQAIGEMKILNREVSGIEEIIQRFLEETKIDGLRIQKACLAVAGPVRDGRCHMTNLSWSIEAAHLSKRFGIPIFTLINDLEAHAHGLPLLSKDDVFVLQSGAPQTGNQALAFCGTGLGEAGVFWNGEQFCPFAGEGGHADFAPRNELEIELLLYLKKKYGHVSYERILSGAGLYEIFQFLIHSRKERVADIVKNEMQKKNPTHVIVEMGRNKTDGVCSQALDLFLSIYGAEAGNLALKFLSLGGIYIGGGMISHLGERVRNSSFLSSFCDKGRFKALLESIPVTVVLVDNTALLGAAVVARKSL